MLDGHHHSQLWTCTMHINWSLGWWGWIPTLITSHLQFLECKSMSSLTKNLNVGVWRLEQQFSKLPNHGHMLVHCEYANSLNWLIMWDLTNIKTRSVHFVWNKLTIQTNKTCYFIHMMNAPPMLSYLTWSMWLKLVQTWHIVTIMILLVMWQ